MMLAYRAHPAVARGPFLDLVRGHRAADRLVKGRYWHDGRGCAVGCAARSALALTGRRAARAAHGDHAALARMLGVPAPLLHLQDAIFELLPEPEHLDWPLAFAEAIPDGADLSGVWRLFAVWLLREVALPAAGSDLRAAAAVRRIADGIESHWASDDQHAAARAAFAAADDAAVAARIAAAAATAAYAARAAAADDAAVAARIAAAARASIVRAMRDRLLALLRAAPVPPSPVRAGETP